LAQFGWVEADARTVAWSSLTRLALEGGLFQPAYRPVTEAEIAGLLAVVQERTLVGDADALVDDSEYGRLLWLLDRYRNGGGGVVWDGCPGKAHPPHLRLGGRVVGGYSGLGDPIPFEGGLGFVAGHNLFLEPAVEFGAGNFWAVVDFRVGGRLAAGGSSVADLGGEQSPLTWPGWHRATGRADVRDWRLSDGVWQGQVTRALIGMQLGRWAVSAGWDQRRTGPGLTGNLNLDYQGRPLPAVTVRRTASFHWRGIMTHLAPDQMLLRTGLLSRRTVTYHDEFGHYAKEANPWFFQWLIGWNITPWFRTHFTHSVMATAREGTLWPDLLQINFPVIGTTWREQESGPITDRLFAVQFEFRWRDAPWPLLPSRAGRLFWDYGGDDFLPSGPGGVVPQISIPASVLGFELVGPRWDLGFEYAELWHDKVVWYTNGGYHEGYSQEQTLMGHPLGGSGESFTALTRLRPANLGCQFGLQGQLATWGIPGHTPGTGRRYSLAVNFRRTPQRDPDDSGIGPATSLLWDVTAEWVREQADRDAYLNFPRPESSAERDWWRIYFKVGI